jgi:hypothetical protein
MVFNFLSAVINIFLGIEQKMRPPILAIPGGHIGIYSYNVQGEIKNQSPIEPT